VGHWDRSLRVYRIAPLMLARSIDGFDVELLQILMAHKARTTCQSLDKDFVVTGSDDCTVVVWSICTQGKDSGLIKGVKQTLRGHLAPVISVECRSDLNLCLSSSKGKVLLHRLRDGAFLRDLSPSKTPLCSLLSISDSGYIALWDNSISKVHISDCNGVFEDSWTEEDHLYTQMLLLPDDHIALGTSTGEVHVRSLVLPEKPRYRLQLDLTVSHRCTMTHHFA